MGGFHTALADATGALSGTTKIHVSVEIPANRITHAAN